MVALIMLCALVCTVPLILICGTIAPLRGESGLVIFADDFVATFQFKEDATRFLEAVKERFALFGLELEPSKTRLVEFGRFAEENRKKRGEGKPETFDFLGFTHYCSRSHKTGKFRMKRKTAQKKYRMKLKEMNTWIKQNRHRRLKDLTSRLNLKLRGHYQYYGITDNSKSIGNFLDETKRMLFKWLNRAFTAISMADKESNLFVRSRMREICTSDL